MPQNQHLHSSAKRFIEIGRTNGAQNRFTHSSFNATIVYFRPFIFVGSDPRFDN